MPFTFLCLSENKGAPYVYVGVFQAERVNMDDIKSVYSGFYRGKWEPEITMYQVRLWLSLAVLWPTF